jgi:hypothetical protein
MKQFINFFKPILFVLGITAILQIIVLPGLTAADTIINILSLLIGISLIYVTIKYTKLLLNKPVTIKKPIKRKPKTTK